MLYVASRSRRQEEGRKDRADQALLDNQNRDWEEAEAAADEYDFLQALKSAKLESQRIAEANTQWTATRTRVKPPVQDLSEFSPMEVKEEALLRGQEKLDRERKKLKTEMRNFQRLKQRYAPYGHLLPRSHSHRRRSGMVLTDDERRAVLHCYEMCLQEHSKQVISTVAPIQRTAHYLGMATKTVQDAVKGIKTRDKRGRYIRTLSSTIFEPYISNLAKEWNMEGTPVTLKKIRKSLRDNWGGTHEIPSFETLRRHLHRMGLGYDRTDKAKNYVETPDIRLKRRHYLRERYSDKYEGALFVWLDESYIHHHHVHNKVQTKEQMNNSLRCVCIMAYLIIFLFLFSVMVLRKDDGSSQE